MSKGELIIATQREAAAAEVERLRLVGEVEEQRMRAEFFKVEMQALREERNTLREERDRLRTSCRELVKWGPLAESLDVAEFRVDVRNAETAIAKAVTP